MKKQWKRMMAFLLTFVLLSTNLLTAYASEGEAEAAIQQHVLTLAVTGNGTAALTGDDVAQNADGTYTVSDGSNVVVNASPQDGYELKQILLDGNGIQSAFVMPEADARVDVVFQEIVQDIPQTVMAEGMNETEQTQDVTKEAEETEQTQDVTKDANETEQTQDVTKDVNETEQTQDVVKEADGTEQMQDTREAADSTDDSAAPSGMVTNSKGITVSEALLCDDPDCLEKHVGVTLDPSEVGEPQTITMPSDSAYAELFGAGNKNGISLFSTRMVQSPYVGMNLSGWNASVLFLGVPGTAGSFSVTIYDGALAGASGIGWCLDHTAANPGEGAPVQCTWTATCTAISGNMATWSIVATPPGVTDGVTMVNGALAGYQHVGMSATLQFEEPKGNLEIYKASALPELTQGNSCYSLAGAVYGLYKNGQEITRLTTDENGYARANDITSGSYILKEITPPKGYALDTREYPVTINSNQTTRMDVKDYPQNDPVAILLGKVDAETTQNIPQGSATLENAEFTIKYYDGLFDTDPAEEGAQAIRSWIMRTDDRGFTRLSDSYKVSGDDFYYHADGYITLPLGTITIQETKAPEGYLLNDEVFVRQITSDGTAESVYTYNEPIVKEDIIRGDLSLVKFRQDGDAIKTPLEGIIFEVTSKTTGEKVMDIVTDEKGFATTRQEGSDRGGLVHDTYIVHEKNAPEGLKPVADFEFTISEEGQTAYYIIENQKILSPVQLVKTDSTTGKTIPVADTEFMLLDKDKNPIAMDTHYPGTETHETFLTDETGTFMLPEKLEAGVYYFREINAPEGYLLSSQDLKFEIKEDFDWDSPLVVTFEDAPAMGKIHIQKTDEETGDALAGAEFQITAAEDIITPDGTVRASAGEVVDTVITDQEGKAESTALYLGKYSVTETKQPEGYILSAESWEVELLYKDQNTAVVTEEIEAANQPNEVKIIKIDAETEEPLEGVTFRVWNKATGTADAAEEYTTDKDGVIDIKRLVPGTYEIQETETLPGYVLDDTIYEITIDEDGKADGKDVGEVTVKNVPTKLIGTTAKDKDTQTHQSVPKKETTFIDTVEFKNLQVGETYTVKGVLMDKETGKALLVDGKEVTGETTFTAEEADGTVDVVFTFDASALKGKEIVVFEKAYIGEKEILAHEDIEDENQTIEFPDSKISTTAKDKASGTQEAIAKKDVTIVDTVKYENLIAGKEYTVKGVLMDKETGKALLVDGKEITAEKTFTPEKPSGTVDVEFTLDASSLKQKQTVVFEKLFVDGIEVAAHEDINDKGQTITFKVGSLKPSLPGNRGNGMSVKTGDAAVWMPYVLLALFAAAIAATVLFQKKTVHKGETGKDDDDR